MDISLTISPIKDASGSVIGASEIVHDITGRKQLHDALRKSEEKFSKAFRRSPMALTLTSLETHRYLDVNETFERLTGWKRDEVLGKTPLEMNFWVDLEQRAAVMKRLLAEGTIRDCEFEYRCRDGSHRVALAAGELIDIEDRPCVLAVIADITDRKRAEEALSGISRKLIEAQEQERARIGRDLHDDIAQRVALSAVQLQQLEHSCPEQFRGGLDEIRMRILDVVNTVQTMSHELHSSKLEYLGMMSAIRSFCGEFAERYGVQIDLKSQDLPAVLEPGISLCLFRVLQEALHNAVKHSRGTRFDVQLWGSAQDIHLTVRDFGIGFDATAARAGTGLGLTSMQERLKLVNGTLSIDSQPKLGTVVHASVPLPSASDALQAVG